MLPVFPLDIAILPEESVALHLFEPQYISLFNDCKDGEEFVVLFTNKKGQSDFGTIVYIDETINEFPDGTVDVIIKGKVPVKIKNFHEVFPEKSYSGVEYNIIEIEKTSSEKLVAQFIDFMKTFEKTITKPEPYSIYYIANRLELSYESKNTILSFKKNSSLNLFLINEIRLLRNVREQEAQLNKNFHLN